MNAPLRRRRVPEHRVSPFLRGARQLGKQPERGKTPGHITALVSSMSRLFTIAIAVAWLGPAGMALAQAPTATIEVRLKTPPDSTSGRGTPVPVQLRSA